MIPTELDFEQLTYANNSTCCHIQKTTSLMLKSRPVEPLCGPDMADTAEAFEPSRSRNGSHFLRY